MHAVVAWATTAIAAEPGSAAGVLVLRNGSVVEGAVRQAGAYYRVATANATLQIPAAQVEMLCADLDEAYESRRRMRGGSSADSHLELAQWCLRQNLLDHAGRELKDARALDARHPGIGTLELQLRQLVELQAPSRTTSLPAQISPPPLRPPTPGSALPATPFEISGEARAQFVRSVQPMLIHTCATGGCHQPGGKQRLQLDRWALAGNGNATLVRRNLASALNEVVKSDPAGSPLILRAGEPHGSEVTKSRSFDARQMKILCEWLNEACDVKPPEAEPGETGTPETQPMPATSPAESGQTDAGTFVPRDAFDAEIFNRRNTAAASGSTADSQPAAQ